MPLTGRYDGGPTSWQAVIEPGPTPPRTQPAHREFVLALADFQQAYWNGRPVNPPGRREIPLSTNNDLLERYRPYGMPTCPELVSAADTGTMVLNYRNEPLALRVRDPLTNGQAAGAAGDLSFAFRSDITRADGNLNVQPGFYDTLTSKEDVRSGDPFTPTLRVYEGDRVQMRILVGAHEEGHNFSVHGIKWLFEPSEPDSGNRNSQMMGISEHFEFVVPQDLANTTGLEKPIDRLYTAGAATDDLWNGIWGLLRSYRNPRPDLQTLSSNPGATVPPPGSFGPSCPKDAPIRAFDVTAVAAIDALPNGAIVYNPRIDGSFGMLSDPTSILYFRSSDLEPADHVLRVSAGCPSSRSSCGRAPASASISPCATPCRRTSSRWTATTCCP